MSGSNESLVEYTGEIGGDKVEISQSIQERLREEKVKPLRQECVLGMIRQSVWLQRVRERERESEVRAGEILFLICVIEYRGVLQSGLFSLKYDSKVY